MLPHSRTNLPSTDSINSYHVISVNSRPHALHNSFADRGVMYTLTDGRVVEEYVVDGAVDYHALMSTSSYAQRRVDELCAKHGLARYVIDDHYEFQPRVPRTRPHNDLVALPFPMVGSFFDMSGGIGAGLGGQSQIAVTPCYRHEKNGNILLTWNIRVLLL